MEDARRQHGIGTPLGNTIRQMLQITDPPTGDDRDSNGVGNGAGL
jgi:hypothetical protein